MPDYVYNLVYRLNDRRVVEEHVTPHAFAGTPEEFGWVTLLDFIGRTPAVGDELVAVNVWHSDREGVGVPGPHRVLVSTLDLDTGPSPPNLLEIDHYTYYIAEAITTSQPTMCLAAAAQTSCTEYPRAWSSRAQVRP